MKILFCSKTRPVHGGVERWMAQLVAGLQSKSCEVVLGLASGHQFHNVEQYLSVYPELSTVSIRIIDGTSGIAEGRRRALEALLADERPDIVVPVMLHETLGAVAARRKAGQETRIAYPVHEDAIRVFRSIEEYKDQIDAVVSVSRLFLDALDHALEWPKERLFHVRSGVPLPTVIGTPLSGHAPLHLGFCARLQERQKRISDLAALCKELDLLNVDYRLIIAGGGAEAPDLSERLQSQISQGQVKFLGWQSQSDLYKSFYPKIDALIITSDWETGPMVAWEAMMHGVLVITSQYRGITREGLLHQGQNALIFPVGHPAKAALMIKEVHQKRERFALLAKRGRQFAENALSVQSMVEAWVSVLSTVASLLPRDARTENPYSSRQTIKGRVEHRLRHLLNRPYHHRGSDAEWPRYKPERASSEEQAQWIEELKRLEDGMRMQFDDSIDQQECL